MHRIAAAFVVLGLAICEVPKAADLTQIDAGFDQTFTLQGSDRRVFAISGGETLLVTIENLGRDTVLTFTPESEGVERVRAANWRGIEHLYTAIALAGAPGVLEIAADEAVGPPGHIRIRAEQFTAQNPEFSGEWAMFNGSDLRLRHYYGGGDFRTEAIRQFEQAASVFGSVGNSRRQADAFFEAAVALMELGEHDEALGKFSEAKEIWIELGDERGVAAADVHAGLVFWRTNRPYAALDRLRVAATRRKALGDDYYFAQANNNIGLVYRDLGDPRSALVFFREALTIWQGEADLLSIDPDAIDLSSLDRPPYLSSSLIAVNNLGWAYEVMADTANTRLMLTQGLALSQYLDRGRLAAELKSNLGRLEYATGNLQLALDYLDEALEYFVTISPDEVWAANVHHSRARVFRASGDTRRAELAFEEALRLRTEERDPAGRASTLLELAELKVQQTQAADARSFVLQALSLLGNSRSNRRERANAHVLAGRSLDSEGQHAEAVVEFDRAVDIHAAEGDRRGEARARSYRAQSQHAQGFTLEATADLRVALELAEQIRDRLLEVQILTRTARFALSDGNGAEGRRSATAAIDRSEAMRDEIVDPLLLRDFAATQREAFDVLIHAELGAGATEAAFVAADLGRARLFADRVSTVPGGSVLADEQTQERYESLLHMRAALADERTDLLSHLEGDDDSQRLQRVETELASTVDEIERLQSTTRRASTRDLQPVSLDLLQDSLNENSAVLQYHFGDLGSGVFLVTHDELRYHAFADDSDLTTLIERAVAAIRSPAPSENADTKRLSRALLAPLAEYDPTVNHLIVVPDGALYYLPFDVLYEPQTDFEEPLVASRDISYLPSISALFNMRAASVDRRRGSGIAVVADPVFEASDARITPTVAERREPNPTVFSGPLKRSAARAGRRSFPRLPGTRDESRVIDDVAGDIPVHTLLDTDANLDAVLGGGLRDYGILHFATHGILDPEEPALSGLVLSGVTAEGSPRRQFLRSQDIAALDLRADLVVLSGCDTALGRVVRGEGLHSLSRAFFYAGARQVVSSLWQVPDQATSFLMRHLYTEMLVNGETPARALRLAKLAVRADRRWRHPYFWAAFIAQGDWAYPLSFTAEP